MRRKLSRKKQLSVQRAQGRRGIQIIKDGNVAGAEREGAVSGEL